MEKMRTEEMAFLHNKYWYNQGFAGFSLGSDLDEPAGRREGRASSCLVYMLEDHSLQSMLDIS